MEAKEYLAAYYENYDENSRLLSNHGRVEFATTMLYIKKYIGQGMRVIEIGAGTGRYSHALARMGYQVDAVELIEHNIDIFNQNTEDGEMITVCQGDARDLSQFNTNTYDIVLLLGPMYHLFTEEDKIQALSEAVRVAKGGGIIFAAYCMADPSIVGYGFIRNQIHNLVEKKMIDTEVFKPLSNPWDLFELHRVEDIDRLRSHFNVEQLNFVAADGFTNYIRDTVDQMDSETFDIYLKYHFAICERPELVGWSHHTIDIFRKR